MTRLSASPTAREFTKMNRRPSIARGLLPFARSMEVDWHQISRSGGEGAVADVVEIWMTLSPAFSGYRVMRQRQAFADPS